MTNPNTPNQRRHLLIKLYRVLFPLLVKLIFLLIPYLFFPYDINITIHSLTLIWFA